MTFYNRSRKPKAELWYVYLLRCNDGSYYCGATTNVEARLWQHNKGAGSKYVRSRRPAEVIVHSRSLSKSEALRAEARIKKLAKTQKVAAVQAL